jgi:monooxygenase
MPRRQMAVPTATPRTTPPEAASRNGDRPDEPLEHVDVLIVGAGLSGIGAASQLRMNSPRKSFAVLEARDSLGGTWDLFRYPGIRSDSDMYTLGYSFRPWEEAEAIADGPAILDYIRETARDFGIDREIHFNHRVVRAEWSTEEARWTVDVECDGGETRRMTCAFLHLCTGYYRYDAGFTPEFEGSERFRGEIVHPQLWPEVLDYTGKRVVVIGSGATAVTLVPAMADRAEHVTMLQRSPSYVISLPARDAIAERLNRALPAKVAYPIVRWKQALIANVFYRISRKAPRLIRALIRRGAERRLPAGYDVDTHFNPSYDPWDQRVCLVPDGDLFDAVASGHASIVTDRISTFTEKGLALESGDELEADVIITATGLNVLLFGDMEIAVDGSEVDLSRKVSYKGMMLSGVPNLAYALGYTNASWTLKCDLVSKYVCRLVNHMDEHGYDYCTPRGPDPSLPTEPLIDLKSGYVLRSIEKFPKQGQRAPWRLHQNYTRDLLALKYGGLDDEAMEFARAGSAVGMRAAAAA